MIEDNSGGGGKFSRNLVMIIFFMCKFTIELVPVIVIFMEN